MNPEASFLSPAELNNYPKEGCSKEFQDPERMLQVMQQLLDKVEATKGV
jgi:hypothetical protein